MKTAQVCARALAAVAVVGIFGACGLITALPAAAADVSPVVVGDIAISNQSAPGDLLHLWEKAIVTVEIDSDDQPVHADDTFQVNFPDELRVTSGPFELRDQDTDTTLADCNATSDSNYVVCTFNSAAASRDWVAGSMSVTATAVKYSNSYTVEFGVPGEPTPRVVALPGNTSIQYPHVNPYPWEPFKRGWAWSDSGDPNKVAFTWEMNFKVDESVNFYEIEDTVAAPQALGTEYSYAFKLMYRPPGTWWNSEDPWSVLLNEGTTTFDYEGTSVNAELTLLNPTSFKLKLPQFGQYGGEDEAHGSFQLHYIATVASTTPSQMLKNSATINGVSVSSLDIDYQQPTGSLYGPGYGGFSLTKVAAGSGADLAQGDVFTVNATWNGQTSPIKVTAGGAAYQSDPIPTGTEVTLTEPVVATEDGYTYTPAFLAGKGVTVSSDGGSAVVAIADQRMLEVTLNNVVTATPTTPVTTPGPTPATTPAAATTGPIPGAGGNEQPDLAQTGADAPVWVMATGALIILVGGVLIARRRTLQE